MYGWSDYTNESGRVFGIDNTDWKYLGLYAYGEKAGGFEAFAEDSPNNASGFNCRARGTNGEYYDLAGHSDGSLLWAGRHIVRSVNGVGAGTDGNVAITIPSAYVHPSTHPASMITGLAKVATSGSYNDLSNRPSIYVGTPNYNSRYTLSKANGSAPNHGFLVFDLLESNNDTITVGGVSFKWSTHYTHSGHTVIPISKGTAYSCPDWGKIVTLTFVPLK